MTTTPTTTTTQATTTVITGKLVMIYKHCEEREKRKISKGHSNSLVENKLTPPWLKKDKEQQTHNSTQNST